MNVPLRKLWIDKNELLEVKEVLKSGLITTGNASKKLEELVSEYLGVSYVIPMSSHESALYLAVLSIIKQNEGEILLPDCISFGFSELLNKISGLEKIFVDVDSKTYNIDYKDLKRKYNKKKTRAVVISHSFGQAADMDKIVKFTNKKNIPVIENGFLGSKYKGYRCGTIGLVSCLQLETGSLLVTNDFAIANFANLLAVRYDYQMDELSAAFEIAQFKKLQKIIKKKNSLARYWNKRLKELDFISAPYIRKGKGNVHTYEEYNCLTSPVTNRDKVFEILFDNGIECSIGIPFNRGDVSRDLFNRLIKLPLFYKLKKSEIDYIIDVLKVNRDRVFI